MHDHMASHVAHMHGGEFDMSMHDDVASRPVHVVHMHGGAFDMSMHNDVASHPVDVAHMHGGGHVVVATRG